MITFIIVVVVAVVLASVAVLTVIVAGVRAEERHMTLTRPWPHTLAGAVSRRVLGVYVRRPRQAPDCEPDDSAPYPGRRPMTSFPLGPFARRCRCGALTENDNQSRCAKCTARARWRRRNLMRADGRRPAPRRGERRRP